MLNTMKDRSHFTIARRLATMIVAITVEQLSDWRKLGAGVGVISRSVTYAAVDNTVILPGYVRADAALSYSISPMLRLQMNVENVLDREDFVNADGNNNISPRCRSAFRFSLATRF